MINNPRTGLTEDPSTTRCDQCGKIPAHECLWVVDKGDGRTYQLRATLCERHERESAEHMERLKKRVA